MSDDKTKTGKADDIRINTAQNWELSYWTRKFTELLKRKVSRKDIRAAVKIVGPMAKHVQRHLEGTP